MVHQENVLLSDKKLQELCEDFDLAVSGNKDELVDRIMGQF